MTKLFILNHPNSYQDCLTAMSNDDELILIEDAVQLAPSITVETPYPIYALSDDLIARGIADKVPAQIQTINYDEFVDLTLKHETTLSWT